MDKPACLCEGIMTFLMDNKRSAIWECENCGRLLFKPYHADWQRWYQCFFLNSIIGQVLAEV